MTTQMDYSKNPLPSGLTQRKKPVVFPEYETWKANPNPKTLGPLVKKLEPIMDKALRTYGGTFADSLLYQSRPPKFCVVFNPKV